jgi:hypothetical protein
MDEYTYLYNELRILYDMELEIYSGCLVLLGY